MIMSCIIHGLNVDPHTAYYKVHVQPLEDLRIRLQESYIRMNLGEINVACDTEMQHSGSERNC